MALHLEESLMEIVDANQEKLDHIAVNSLQEYIPIWFGNYYLSIRQETDKANNMYEAKVFVDEVDLAKNPDSHENYAPLYNKRPYRRYRGGNAELIQKVKNDIESKINWLL